MHNKSKLLAVVGTACALFAVSAPAHAQATRTFVSGVGNDADPCSRTAPCKTFAGAISKTFINGEIDCLDPGGFGTLTITKSITIDCTGTLGSVLASGTNGFNINIAVNANDPFRTVRLRGLTINGTGASGTIGTRTGLKGISITQAAVVILEDLVISDFSLPGIVDARPTPGGKLIIRNSVIRNNTGAGISVAGAATNNALLDNVHSVNNGFGVATAIGNNVSIIRSVFSGNTTAGVEGDGGSQVGLENSLVSGNVTGLQNGGTMSISNSEISFNTTGITGTTASFGNNRIFGNTSAGTAPTLGLPSSDHGQQ
jgi:Right handed beta helix region